MTYDEHAERLGIPPRDPIFTPEYQEAIRRAATYWLENFQTLTKDLQDARLRDEATKSTLQGNRP